MFFFKVLCTVGAKFFLNFRSRKNHIINFKLPNTWVLSNANLEAQGISTASTMAPQRRKIPPELTNRYVKNEAFIVVVFNNILTVLLPITITITIAFSPDWLRSQSAPLANCQCGNASSNSILISKYLDIRIFLYLNS